MTKVERVEAVLERIKARMLSDEPIRFNANVDFDRPLQGDEEIEALTTLCATVAWTVARKAGI